MVEEIDSLNELYYNVEGTSSNNNMPQGMPEHAPWRRGALDSNGFCIFPDANCVPGSSVLDFCEIDDDVAANSTSVYIIHHLST